MMRAQSGMSSKLHNKHRCRSTFKKLFETFFLVSIIFLLISGLILLNMSQDTITVEDLPALLEHDISVKVAGIDCDGILRGKVMAKEKFLSIAQKGFGFSSAVFGWDMQDVLYTTDAKIAPPESGYVDFIAVPDLSSYRRIPWEDNIPFFLVRFVQNEKPVAADGRSMLRAITDKLAEANCQAMAGGKFPGIGPSVSANECSGT